MGLTAVSSRRGVIRMGKDGIVSLGIYHEFLQLILAGQKTVELRTNYPELMDRIEVGTFFRLNEKDELYRVTRVKVYGSLEEALRGEEIASICPQFKGLPISEILNRAKHCFVPADVKRHGVKAFSFKEVEP